MPKTSEPADRLSTGEIALAYPAHWEADVVLRDGATAHLRPVIPTDAAALNTMYAGQSERSIYLRFFAPKPTLSDKELKHFTTVDHANRVALVLFLGDEMIGIGRYDRVPQSTVAEVAFLISDHHQGRGIGSILLEHLAAAALERGIERFSAEVLPANRGMLNVFADAGYEISRDFEDGFVQVDFDIDPTDRSREVMETREHRAESKSIAELLSPEKVAVIGSPATWSRHGAPALANIVKGGYRGELFGVCPETDRAETGNTETVTIVESIADVPGPVDLAVITVAVDEVASAVDACGRAGVRGALILTDGYAEDGVRGRARQRALVRAARGFGMRIIGPASFGVLNNDPEVNLDITLTDRDPRPGTLGLFSQSAAIGEIFSHSATRRNLGVSSLVSAGNRADVSGNDLMQYWEDDENTHVCALFLESIGNPRKFSRIARRLSRTKPVIVTRNTFTGLQLPPGHAGRTSIAPTEALDAMFTQCGVISAVNSDQVLDIAQLLQAMPLPTGRRVAVISNAAALAQMVSDRAVTNGLEIKFKDTLETTGDEALHLLSEVFTATVESSDIDVLIGIFLTEGGADPHQIVADLLAAAQTSSKPVLAIFPGIIDKAAAMDGLYSAEHGELPCYHSPAAAVDALAKVTEYVQWRKAEQTEFVRPSAVAPKEVAALLADRLQEVQGEDLLTLSVEDTRVILANYGIDILPSRVVTDVSQAREVAEELGGYPVVLKSTDEFLARRLDLGGTRLNVETPDQLDQEFASLMKTVRDFGGDRIAVQKQAPAGQAAILRGIEDPLLGPVISFGMSGDATALLGDWAHRIPPLTQHDVDHLIKAPKAAQRLWGENEQLGEVRVDLLKDLTQRLSLLKDNHPEISSVQLAPIIISPQQLTVANARIAIGNPQQRTDSARRTMSTAS